MHVSHRASPAASLHPPLHHLFARRAGGRRVWQAGCELLMMAEKGEAASARALVEVGADVNFRDSNRMTPLHVAAKNGKTETIAALIAARANLEEKDKVCGAEGQTQGYSWGAWGGGGVAAGGRSGGCEGCWLAACRLERCSDSCGTG